jgi:hypothetical protein
MKKLSNGRRGNVRNFKDRMREYLRKINKLEGNNKNKNIKNKYEDE